MEGVLSEMKSNTAYLDPEFKLGTIAAQSGFPPHHLTYYFNTILDVSFTEWRNKLRIDYAIHLLNQGHTSQLTLEAISLKSGFTAQNTFIRSFKLYTGQTPSEYMKARGWFSNVGFCANDGYGKELSTPLMWENTNQGIFNLFNLLIDKPNKMAFSSKTSFHF